MDSVFLTILACTGFWTVINTVLAYFIQRRERRDDTKTITKQEFETVVKGVRGLLYGELEKKCTYYINEGCISPSEINDMREYYLTPYQNLGGDGTIESLFERVEQLPLRK